MNRLTQLKPGQVTLALIILGLVISGLILWQTVYWTKQVASDEIRNRSTNTLKLVVSNLNAELQRFRAQPELISADKRLIPVLNNTADDSYRVQFWCVHRAHFFYKECFIFLR